MMITLEMQQIETESDGIKNVSVRRVWRIPLMGEKIFSDGRVMYKHGRRPIGPQRAAKKRRKL